MDARPGDHARGPAPRRCRFPTACTAARTRPAPRPTNFTLSRRRLKKAKTWPDSGSWCSTSCTWALRRSKDRRRSVAPRGTKTPTRAASACCLQCLEHALQRVTIGSRRHAQLMPAAQDDLQNGWCHWSGRRSWHFGEHHRVACPCALGRRVHRLTGMPEDLPPPRQRAQWNPPLLPKLPQCHPAALPARQHKPHLPRPWRCRRSQSPYSSVPPTAFCAIGGRPGEM
jgi:hypothetical protein